MQAEFYLRSIDRRWKKELSRRAGRVLILSPYLTSRTAELVLAHADTRHCEIYTLFSVENFASGASSLATLKLLSRQGFTLYEIRDLHAKMVVVSGEFASVGSQNLTNAGTKNKEATVAIPDPEEVEKLERLVEPWLKERRPISHEMIEDLEASLSSLKEVYSKAHREAKTIEEKIWREEAKRAREAEEAKRTRKAKMRGIEEALNAITQDGRVSISTAERFIEESACWPDHPLRSHSSSRPRPPPVPLRRRLACDFRSQQVPGEQSHLEVRSKG